MSEFTLRERMTSYHEAGHAVLHYLSCDSVNYIWGKPGVFKGMEFAGATIASRIQSMSTIASGPAIQALVCAGGRVAEQTFFPDDWKKYKEGSETDWEMMRESLEIMEYGPEQIQNVVISARKILLKRENRKLVRKLAWVLLHHNKHLDYIEIGWIFGYIKKPLFRQKYIQMKYKCKKWLKR
jgi:hypothetical protein